MESKKLFMNGYKKRKQMQVVSWKLGMLGFTSFTVEV